MTWVVVIFGGDSEGWCDLNHCPMEAIGPYATHDEAAREAARFPEGFRPHLLLLRPADDLADSLVPRPRPSDRSWTRRHPSDPRAEYACHLCGHTLIAPWQKCDGCGANLNDTGIYERRPKP